MILVQLTCQYIGSIEVSMDHWGIIKWLDTVMELLLFIPKLRELIHLPDAIDLQ